MKASLCLPLFALMVGCIHEPTSSHALGAPVGPPPNPEVVSSCRTTRTWHNVWVIAGTIFGGAGGATGTASAITKDQGVQEGVAIGAAGAALFAAISGAAAGIESDQYATDGCQQILQQAADANTP